MEASWEAQDKSNMQKMAISTRLWELLPLKIKKMGTIEKNNILLHQTKTQTKDYRIRKMMQLTWLNTPKVVIGSSGISLCALHPFIWLCS